MGFKKIFRNGCIPPLTKEEVLMNVCERPETRSNIFIERGKITVFEKPQRLGQTPILVNWSHMVMGFIK